MLLKNAERAKNNEWLIRVFPYIQFSGSQIQQWWCNGIMSFRTRNHPNTRLTSNKWWGQGEQCQVISTMIFPLDSQSAAAIKQIKSRLACFGSPPSLYARLGSGPRNKPKHQKMMRNASESHQIYRVEFFHLMNIRFDGPFSLFPGYVAKNIGWEPLE